MNAERASFECFSLLMTPATLLFEVCPNLVKKTEFLYGSPMKRVGELNAIEKKIIYDVSGMMSLYEMRCSTGSG